jgi:hypothetical protein
MADKTQKIQNIGVKGLIREAAVDSSLIPDTAVLESTNWNFDRIGVAQVRPGLTALGSTVLTSRPAVGMQNVQTNTAVVVFSNGSSATIFSYGTSSTPSAWAVSLDGGTASVKIRFTDFSGYTVTPNFSYNTLSSMRFWDGGTRNWKYTGNPINPQNMWGYNPQLVEVYKSRMYAAGDPAYKSRLFFSSVIDITGNITWTPTSDYVDINPGDGEDFTAMKRYSLELLLFKPNYIYRFKTTGVDPDPLIKIGTRSNESIVEGTRGLYFHNDTGFYQYTGGYPTKISQPIVDIIEAIPYSQYANIVGWSDSDHIYWSIGNVTIPETYSNLTIKNCVVRYTESSGVWTVYSYSQDVRRAMTFNNGTTLSRLVALDNGVVATQNSGFTDLGEPIKYRLKTKWYDFGEIATRKILQDFAAVCEKAQASEIAYQVDEDPTIKTFPGGELKKMVNYFYRLNIKFHRIRFIIQGTARFDSPIFRSIEMLDIQTEGIIKE